MQHKSLFLIVFLSCSLFAVAEDLELAQPHVAVFGTAEIKVTPNEMNWSVNVNTKDKSLKAAAQKHTDTVKKVLEFLKGLKVDEDKLQTTRMQFGEEWNTVNRERIKTGYFASTNIHFMITDFDLYEKIWFALAEMEGVSIQGTSYSHSDRIKYQNESRQKAVLAAREKAETLARTLGTQIIDPLKIEELSSNSLYELYSGSNSSNLYSLDMGGGVEASSLAPGQITITTRVKVYFKLMSRP